MEVYCLPKGKKCSSEMKIKNLSGEQKRISPYGKLVLTLTFPISGNFYSKSKLI